MRKTIAAILVYLAIISGVGIAATTQADAHTPTCHFGTVWPYMFLSRTRGADYGSWSIYSYKYVNLITQSIHYDTCRFYMA